MKQTYTQQEVIELLLAERRRAKEICYNTMTEFKLKAGVSKNMGNKYGEIKDNTKSEISRILGNQISGANALSSACGEIMRDRIVLILKEPNKNESKRPS